MSYAENTSVSVTKTKADIEELIIKAGAGQFLSGYKENMAVIGFSLANRQIRFVLPLPNKQDEASKKEPEMVLFLCRKPGSFLKYRTYYK